MFYSASMRYLLRGFKYSKCDEVPVAVTNIRIEYRPIKRGQERLPPDDRSQTCAIKVTARLLRGLASANRTNEHWTRLVRMLFLDAG